LTAANSQSPYWIPGGTQQSGHAPRSGPEVKMEDVVPKMARRKGGTIQKEGPSLLLCRSVLIMSIRPITEASLNLRPGL